MKTILSELDIGGNVTRSELEVEFIVFVGEVRLPPPEVNARVFVGGIWIECDFL